MAGALQEAGVGVAGAPATDCAARRAVRPLPWCRSGGRASRAERRVRHLMFARPLVESLWCHVDAVGPDDGADLGVDADLGEEGLVSERLEHAAPVPSGEVDVTDDPVLEGE